MENKKQNFLASGKATTLACIINIVFAAAGIFGFILSIADGASGQYLVILIVELLLYVASIAIACITLFISSEKVSAFKRDLALFIVNACLVYFTSTNLVIALVYVLCGVLMVMDMAKNIDNNQKQNKTNKEEAKQEENK